MIVEVDGVRLDVPDDATPDEIGALAGPAPVATPERTWGDATGDALNSFFGRGDPRKPTEFSGRDLAKQYLKAGAFLVPGAGAASLLGSGAMLGAGTSDAEDTLGMLKDSGKGAAAGYVGGKLIQGVGNRVLKNLAGPEQVFSPTRDLMARTVAPNAPIINVAPTGAANIAATPAVAAAAAAPQVLSTEPAVGRLTKLITGSVNPTPNASLLMSKGVRLPRSMQDPFSEVNQVEQAMQSVNPRLIQQRAVPVDDFRIAALNEVLPPGMKPIPIGTQFADGMGQVSNGFGRAYNEAGGFPIYPAVHGKGGGPLQGTSQTPGLIEQSIAGVKMLPPSERAAITSDVLDELARLPPRKGAVGQVDSADLLTVRSVLRSKGRKYREDHTTASNHMADAYGAAEDVVTAALKSQLPTSVTRGLDKTDAAYANFKAVEEAVRSARGQVNGFSPGQLQRATTRGESGVNIGTNDVSALHDLSRAASDIFQVTSPPNGGRVATLAAAGRFFPRWAAPEWATKRVVGTALERGNDMAMNAAPVMVDAMRPRLPGMPGPTMDAPGAVLGPASNLDPRSMVEFIRRLEFGPARGLATPDQERNGRGR
jgi:hypothetical protein